MSQYALDWMMKLPGDYHFKQALVANPTLQFDGFIFPHADISTLEGKPVFGFDTAPRDLGAWYVDNSASQEQSHAYQVWCREHALQYVTQSEWLAEMTRQAQNNGLSLVLYPCTTGPTLVALQTLRLDQTLVARYDSESRQRITTLLHACQTLDLRGLFPPYPMTVGHFINSILQHWHAGQAVAMKVTLGASLRFALSSIQIHYSFNPEQSLEVCGLHDEPLYDTLALTRCPGRPVRLILLNTSELATFHGAFAPPGPALVLMRLERGLLDLNECTTVLLEKACGAKVALRFVSLSSRFEDNFIVAEYCHGQSCTKIDDLPN